MLSPGITGLILAGGKARRMASIDKGLIRLAGKPLYQHVADRLQPQVAEIIISANRNLHEYESTGLQVVADELADYPGPLAGVQAALQACNCEFLLTVPCDAPLLTLDYAQRMFTAMRENNTTASVAYDGSRLQPVHMLIQANLLPSLHQYLESGQRKTQDWLRSVNAARADFSDSTQQFINANTEEDKKILERLMVDVA